MEMTPEKWERVKVLFEAALDRRPEARLQYLADACSEDDLRAEVARLLTNLEDAGSFLKKPALTGLDLLTTRTEDGFLPPGHVLAGRFKVIRFLARGGMGEVYEAEDLELKEHVALKLVRPELLVDRHAVQRIKREVHLAKKVTHPNVCRTFDLFRHHDVSGDSARDLIFVSMELLVGETLSQYLRKQGRLTPPEALPLITQVAGGMEAAHRAGVVHRDFKPGNIILVTQGTTFPRAVITDFGLALQSGGHGTAMSLAMSASHGIVGTPAYMAPEQVEGREVTPATDIYAFGLVIHEMLTGLLPFSSETPFAMAVRRLHEPLPSPRSIIPDLDPSWEAVILRCLERDPSSRFTHVGEIVQALSRTAPITKPSTQSVRVSRRTLVVLLIALLILTTGVTIYTQRVRNARTGRASPPTAVSAPSPVRMRPAVAVLGFRNISRQSEKDWISESLTEGLNSELSQGGQVRLVSGESVARTKADLSLPDSDSYSAGTLRQIRHNTSADYVVLGSFLDLGDQRNGQIRVDARIQDARSGETIDSLIESGSESDLNGLLARTGADLRQKLNLAPSSSQQQTQSRAARPTNLEAARYYAEGLQKLRSFDSLGARESLEMAVSKEPTFALAHAALAGAWANLGYEKEVLSSAKKALELSGSLDDADRLWIEAQYHETAHEQVKAIDTLKVLYTTYPDNLEYGLRLANAQLVGGRPKDAETTLAALKNLAGPVGNDPRIDLAEANVQKTLGDSKQSVAAALAAEQKAESTGARQINALALMRESSERTTLGQQKEAMIAGERARRIFAEVGDRDNFAKVNANLARTLAYEGNFGDAKKLYEESLQEFREIGDKQGQATALLMMGWAAEAQDNNVDEPQRFFEQALVIQRELGNTIRIAETTSRLAEILEYKGDLAGAIRRNEEVLAIGKESGQKPLESNALNNLASIYLRRGELSAAKEVQTNADSILTQTGNKLGLAIALQTWGNILTIENDLTHARQKYEQSLSTLAESGNDHFLPYCRMSLAELNIEEGRTSDAETLLNLAIQDFQAQKSRGGESWALGIYARGELESGNLASAIEKANAAEKVAIHDHSLSDLDVQLIVARVEGLSGNRKSAEIKLKKLLAIAEQQGNVRLAFNARYALGEIALKSQDPSGRKILNDLSRDAASKGFLLLSRKASNLAESANC